MNRMERRAALACSLLAIAPALALAQEAAPALQSADASWTKARLVFLFTAAVVVAGCQLIFKQFERWPRFELAMVLATLGLLPLVAVLVFGSRDAWFFFRAAGPLIDNLALWGLVSAVAFGVWWFFKQRAVGMAPRSATAVLPSERPARTATPATTATAPQEAPGPAARVAEAARTLASPSPAPAAEPAAAIDTVFISYRRQDSADVTGRIYDRLVQQFGRERIFKDVDSIPLGVDFREHLGNVIGRCDLVVAVIGPQWLQVQGPGGRRLDDSGDFVRIEIESALARNIPVVPVLVGGAAMPSAEDLPASLASLSFRNGLAVRPDPDFHRDMDRLIAGLGALNRL